MFNSHLLHPFCMIYTHEHIHLPFFMIHNGVLTRYTFHCLQIFLIMGINNYSLSIFNRAKYPSSIILRLFLSNYNNSVRLYNNPPYFENNPHFFF